MKIFLIHNRPMEYSFHYVLPLPIPERMDYSQTINGILLCTFRAFARILFQLLLPGQSHRKKQGAEYDRSTQVTDEVIMLNFPIGTLYYNKACNNG